MIVRVILNFSVQTAKANPFESLKFEHLAPLSTVLEVITILCPCGEVGMFEGSS